MKYVVILGDGMAGNPVKSRGNKTTLMTADKKSIDSLAKSGQNGKLKTVPEDMPPGSAVANLGVLGYDPKKYFNGRAVLEAASIGVELDENDLALRCNLICVEDGKIKNHSAGHIETEQADELIEALNSEFGSDMVRFHTGTSYRNLLVIKGGSEMLECVPPHDVPGTAVSEVLITAKNVEAEATANMINRLILDSKEFLENHPVNQKRKKSGKSVANSIWPWSPGKKPIMPKFEDLYGISGAIISAVDLIKGIAIYAGMEVIEVEGATGLHDTNYEGKASAAIDALKKHDFVYVHVEASDEAGHEGDFDLKVKCIEYLDKRIVKYIIDHRSEVGDDVTIAVLPDHPTPVELKTHTRDAVPFIINNPNNPADDVEVYDEVNSDKGFYGVVDGSDFINLLIKS